MTNDYKPLTPKLREKMICSIDETIIELNCCESNAFVNVQLVGLRTWKNIIKTLPDGYPIPLIKE